MKGRVVALGQLAGQEAAALMEDGVLSDLLVDTDQPRPGTIYRAVIERPVKGQGGLFVKTPDGNGFLRQVKGMSAGGTVLVQVTGYAEPGKAIPVTAKVLFKSRYAIVTPGAPGINVSRAIKDDNLQDRLMLIGKGVMAGDDNGLILRSACEGANEEAVAEDVARMADLARAVMADATGKPEKLVEGPGPHELAWRDWPDPEIWDEDGQAFEHHGVLDAVEALDGPREDLPGGASIYVEPTRALVAVDVNAGGDTSPAASVKANMAAARALPRALRLRGLGGQVVLDLAPMPKKDRKAFEAALRAAFRRDSVETALVGWTPLGHYELQRKRDRLPLPKGVI